MRRVVASRRERPPSPQFCRCPGLSEFFTLCPVVPLVMTCHEVFLERSFSLVYWKYSNDKTARLKIRTWSWNEPFDFSCLNLVFVNMNNYLVNHFHLEISPSNAVPDFFSPYLPWLASWRWNEPYSEGPFPFSFAPDQGSSFYWGGTPRVPSVYS